MDPEDTFGLGGAVASAPANRVPCYGASLVTPPPRQALPARDAWLEITQIKHRVNNYDADDPRGIGTGVQGGRGDSGGAFCAVALGAGFACSAFLCFCPHIDDGVPLPTTLFVPHLHPCHTVDRPEFEAVLQACRGGLGMVVEAYFDHVDARKIDREARVRVRRIYAGGEVLGHRLYIGWTNA